MLSLNVTNIIHRVENCSFHSEQFHAFRSVLGLKQYKDFNPSYISSSSINNTYQICLAEENSVP